ncbi:uroporphyrinogen-III synthase [Microbulbifer celer]|uniref:Uroporphyrinogen-III synthase n=1 Tax=Microbulbifer celer TaxID=435905 RepID=A0ABW3U4I1_9GAMM|nr:uroporphyrinogen-III synthase [Microbulbifer celer]UFN56826.1 uroporphyrinogen-III synthase [Microbulbifer celer]
MSQSLQGKHILITRPAHQSAGWQQVLAAEGAISHSIPLLAIVPITADSDPEGAQAIKNRILDFDQYDHAIFVSINAVQYGFDWLDDYWPQLPQGPRYYAIGAATARAIQDRGAEPRADSEHNTMDSEALLALPSLQQSADQRVIIFRGRGGRTLMGDTLRQRGARVDYCELYQRQLPAEAESALRDYNQPVDAITVHSGETLDNLHHCLQATKREDLRTLPLICPSVRVATRAHDLGFARAEAAINAGDSAMLAALREALAAG